MKKSTVMLWAIFGALLMGCSDEEIANVETSSRNAIGFNVLSNAAETRAIPTTPDNLTSTDFDVFAFTTDGTAFMGKVDTDFGHDGVKIVYKNGKWDYDDANDLRYWPTEALDFYAFNPGTVSEDMMVFYSWEATKDVQKISYTCMDEYGSGTTHANYDVMYAMAKGQTKDMNNGIVKFNFKHILSQVVFKAKTQYDNMQVDIDVIKIHNLLNSTCKCNRILINNLFKFFVWREVSKSFTRSIIEFIFNPLNLFVGYFTKVLTLWDILPDKPVGVFIGTTFP